MNKDKAWLKDEVKTLFDMASILGKMEYHESEESIHRINSLVDQLDEPETLSQQWIDENKVARINNVRKMTTSDVVTLEKLKNLLVPKQDKPVIPQFVADWIESQDDPIYEMCVNYEMWGVNGDDGTTSFTGEIAEWFDDTLNVENYYRACIDGYEVEKEKKYYVDLDTAAYVAKWDGDGSVQIYTDSISGSDEYELHLTEKEIKDYDERYWAFAEEVTE